MIIARWWGWFLARASSLYLLLGIVAAAAAVLSFSALRDLALVCGFDRELAWLLPVVVDAGAAAGSLVWLGRRANVAAATFARALALSLLALSVAANALGHGLAAFDVEPAWWVVVIVSAIAPTVLGAVVHLAVLVGRSDADRAADEQPTPRWVENDVTTTIEPAISLKDRAAELITAGAGRPRLMRALGVSDWHARQLLKDHQAAASSTVEATP